MGHNFIHKSYWTAELHWSKPELRFCAGSNPARGVSEIRDGEDLWQWSRLEIRLNAFRRSTIPQRQFIIIIIIIIITWLRGTRWPSVLISVTYSDQHWVSVAAPLSSYLKLTCGAAKKQISMYVKRRYCLWYIPLQTKQYIVRI